MTQFLRCIIVSECQQFLVEDESTRDIPSWWNPDDTHRRLSVEEEAVSIGTTTDSVVLVSLEVADNRPEDEDFSVWEQVNECTIGIPSGRIVVREICDVSDSDHGGIDLVPGTYRARIHYEKLTLTPASEWNPKEHYKIVLWKAPPADLTVLKCRLCEGWCRAGATATFGQRIDVQVLT